METRTEIVEEMNKIIDKIKIVMKEQTELRNLINWEETGPNRQQIEKFEELGNNFGTLSDELVLLVAAKKHLF